MEVTHELGGENYVFWGLVLFAIERMIKKNSF
jgi:xylose isomerase